MMKSIVIGSLLVLAMGSKVSFATVAISGAHIDTGAGGIESIESATFDEDSSKTSAKLAPEPAADDPIWIAPAGKSGPVLDLDDSAKPGSVAK